MFFNIMLLAISLSLDALGVGAIYGLRKIKVQFVAKIVICFFSILYSFIAILIGNSLLNIMPNYLAKIIGPLILLIMGIYMIIQGALSKDGEEQREYKVLKDEKTLFKFIIKSIGITIQITKSPLCCDIDKSGKIDIVEAILLGLALSLDAIGVGIGSAIAGFGSFMIPFIIGLVQMIFLYIGTYIGRKLKNHTSINSRIIEMLPGILLIIFALIRL